MATTLVTIPPAPLPAYLDDLALLSMVDCGSYDKEGVDAAGRLMRERLEAADAEVTTYAHDTLGDSLLARWRGAGTARILLIGHLDTVYPRDWPTAHPFHIEGDRAHGPGTADMKAGLLAGLYAVRALHAEGFDDYAEIAFVLNSDEEISSPSSTPLIEREARGRDAVLVLEAGRANGNIVSARKGLAGFELLVEGRAAHAGVEPQKGRSAILELAHHIIALHMLNNHEAGITVNAGTVTGGTRPNVVAAEASTRIDVRARTRADLEATIAAMHAVCARTTVPDTRATLRGGMTHPPMERTAATERLIAWCQEAAKDAGFTVADTATGGGSDGNTTGALGIPTLDGLGPVGGGAHSPEEYLVVSSIVPRIAMLAGLVQRVCAHS